MDTHRFDRVTKLFAHRRLSRRQALARTASGLAAGVLGATGLRAAAAQDAPATPEASGWEKIPYLFVQSFRSGSIAPKANEEGIFTVTLEQGAGQTIYFSDRPARDVGAVPNAAFLDGLGFSEENPPNAALVVETAPGETDIAVVELFNPVVTDDGAGVTYDIQVLANWQESVEFGFSEAPANLAEIEPSFGAAHLFIDDCPTDGIVTCTANPTKIARDKRVLGSFKGVDMCWNFGVCMPCEPYGHVQPSRCETEKYWINKCKTTFPECNDGPDFLCGANFSWPFVNC
jgi:hypothetical protein